MSALGPALQSEPALALCPGSWTGTHSVGSEPDAASYKVAFGTPFPAKGAAPRPGAT